MNRLSNGFNVTEYKLKLKLIFHCIIINVVAKTYRKNVG